MLGSHVLGLCEGRGGGGSGRYLPGSPVGQRAATLVVAAQALVAKQQWLGKAQPAVGLNRLQVNRG